MSDQTHADVFKLRQYLDEAGHPNGGDAMATLANLDARVRELEEDAARYRWLRDGDHDWEVDFPSEDNESGIASWYGCTDKDAAIDAARATDKGEA